MNREKIFAALETLEIADVLVTALSSDKQKSFYAARVLEHKASSGPEKFAPFIPVFLSAVVEVKHPSVMRIFAKILSAITDQKSSFCSSSSIDSFDFDPVVKTLFTWLIDLNSPVAVKVHCMQSLANLTPRYDWISEELLSTIERFEAVESPAYFARAKQIRKKLK